LWFEDSHHQRAIFSEKWSDVGAEVFPPCDRARERGIEKERDKERERERERERDSPQAKWRVCRDHQRAVFAEKWSDVGAELLPKPYTLHLRGRGNGTATYSLLQP